MLLVSEKRLATWLVYGGGGGSGFGGGLSKLYALVHHLLFYVFILFFMYLFTFAILFFFEFLCPRGCG